MRDAQRPKPDWHQKVHHPLRFPRRMGAERKQGPFLSTGKLSCVRLRVVREQDKVDLLLIKNENWRYAAGGVPKQIVDFNVGLSGGKF